MHTASLHGRTEVVETLLKRVSAEGLKARDRCGVSPLLDAIKGRHLKVVEVLIKALSKSFFLEETLLCDYDAIGRLPLDFAAMFGDEKIFVFVLAETAKAQSRKSTGEKESESMFGNLETSNSEKRTLLKRNQHFSRTPLHYAALEGHLSIIKVIINRFINTSLEEVEVGREDSRENQCRPSCVSEISVVDDDGKSPIDLARIGKHSHCVDYLSSLLV